MDELQELLEQLLDPIASALAQLSQRVDKLERMTPFSLNDNEDIQLASFSDVIILWDSHRGPSGVEYRKNLIDRLIASDVRADPRLIHNFIMSLFDYHDYRFALQLCDYVLTLAPFSRDILADAVKSCGELCEWELGITYLSKANAIPKDRWNDKLFTYVGEFLKARFNAYPNNNLYYEEALTLAKEYIHYFQHDEHAYSLKAELLVSAQHRQEAIDFLLDTIRNGYSDNNNRNEKTRIVATQCCVELLQLLDDTCDYDLIIEICNKGLRYTHDQASARIASFVYRRALAYDAKAYAENFSNEKTILNALAEMQSAHTLVTNGKVIANEDKILEDKYEALRPYAGNKFVPLIKRSLTIEAT